MPSFFLLKILQVCKSNKYLEFEVLSYSDKSEFENLAFTACIYILIFILIHKEKARDWNKGITAHTHMDRYLIK